MTQPDYNTYDDSVNDQEIILQEAPRTFYAQIPHIIYELGLDPLAVALYCYYRRIGQCFKGQKTVAQEIGISERKIRDLHKELGKYRKELGDKPLILLMARKKKDGGDAPNLVIITDIWIENDAFFNKSLRAAPNAGGAAPRADKEESLKNIPSKETKEPGDSVASREEEKECTWPKVKWKPYDENVIIPRQLEDLGPVGLDVKDQRRIAQNFTQNAVQCSCLDVLSHVMKKGGPKDIAGMMIRSCQAYDLVCALGLPIKQGISQIRSNAKAFFTKYKSQIEALT